MSDVERKGGCAPEIRWAELVEILRKKGQNTETLLDNIENNNGYVTNVHEEVEFFELVAMSRNIPIARLDIDDNFNLEQICQKLWEQIKRGQPYPEVDGMAALYNAVDEERNIFFVIRDKRTKEQPQSSAEIHRFDGMINYFSQGKRPVCFYTLEESVAPISLIGNRPFTRLTDFRKTQTIFTEIDILWQNPNFRTELAKKSLVPNMHPPEDHLFLLKRMGDIERGETVIFYGVKYFVIEKTNQTLKMQSMLDSGRVISLPMFPEYQIPVDSSNKEDGKTFQPS